MKYHAAKRRQISEGYKSELRGGGNFTSGKLDVFGGDFVNNSRLCNGPVCDRHSVRPHPERAVVGGAEHFGLVRGGDDGQGVDRPHVAGQGPHLLLGFNVPHLQRRKRQHVHSSATLAHETTPTKRPRRDFSLLSSFIGSYFVEIISFIVHENGDMWLL